MIRVLRWLLIAAVAMVALLLVGPAWWSITWGPGTVRNALVYQDTAIDDFRQFPGRELHGAPEPSTFREEPMELATPPDFGTDEALEAPARADGDVSFLVIHDDAIVYERYFEPSAADVPWQIFSASKSILSMLIGAAIEDGYVRSVHEPVTAYVPELADAGFAGVTLEQLLNMTSAMDYDENEFPGATTWPSTTPRSWRPRS